MIDASVPGRPVACGSGDMICDADALDEFQPSPNGGLLAFAALGEAVERRGGLGALGAGRTQDGVRTLRANYYRARARGWLSATMADDMAVRLLGRHPSEVWGDAWWACIEHDVAIQEARTRRKAS